MSHNQFGEYTNNSNWQNLTEGRLSGVISLDNNLKLSYGTNIALLFSEKENSFDVFQAYAGLAGKTISIKAGMFSDEEILGGLSSSNGNIVRSLNYRPYPMIRLSTSDFVPFLFARNWFRFKAEYDEGLLIDDRIVDRPHLHHKSLELRFLTSNTFHLTAGINHYVFLGRYITRWTKIAGRSEKLFPLCPGEKWR